MVYSAFDAQRLVQQRAEAKSASHEAPHGTLITYV